MPTGRKQTLTPEQAWWAQLGLLSLAVKILGPKRRMYSGREDPFANFRLAEIWGIPAYLGALIRLGDKLSRLAYLSQSDGSVLESILDTGRDMVNYACIVILLVLEERGEVVSIDSLVEEGRAFAETVERLNLGVGGDGA